MSITNKIKYLENINDFSKVGLIYQDNSGENLLRYYLEQIFHIKTGSNVKREYTKGNNLIFSPIDDTDSNWLVASDYPSRKDDEYIPVEISCAILLIRNPVDLIMSKVLRDSRLFQDSFNIIDQMIDDWKTFHKYWIKSPIPVHLVRYEDLLIEPEEVLKQMSKFLLGSKTIENTKLEKMIPKVISESSQIDKNLLAFDLVLGEEYKQNMNTEISEKIKKKFEIKLNKILQKYNYVLNQNEELLNWMAIFNRENFVKIVEFHENFNNQFLLLLIQQ